MFCTCGVKAVIMRLELFSHPQPLNMRDVCDTVVACSSRGCNSNWILNELAQAALVLLFISGDVIMKRKMKKRRWGERFVL